MVAQEIKRREEEEDSVRVTPHEGGKDTTLVEVLQKAANKSNPSKDGVLLVVKLCVTLEMSTASRTLPRKLEQLQGTSLVKM